MSGVHSVLVPYLPHSAAQDERSWLVLKLTFRTLLCFLVNIVFSLFTLCLQIIIFPIYVTVRISDTVRANMEMTFIS